MIMLSTLIVLGSTIISRKKNQKVDPYQLDIEEDFEDLDIKKKSDFYENELDQDLKVITLE